MRGSRGAAGVDWAFAGVGASPNIPSATPTTIEMPLECPAIVRTSIKECAELGGVGSDGLQAAPARVDQRVFRQVVRQRPRADAHQVRGVLLGRRNFERPADGLALNPLDV